MSSHDFKGFTEYHNIRCSAGHHIREDCFVITDAGLRCKHREPLGNGQRGYGPECGRLVYVIAGWGFNADLDRFSLAELHLRNAKLVAEGKQEERPLIVYVASVTYDELRRWQRERWSFTRILRELGAWYPDGDPRAGGARGDTGGFRRGASSVS